MRDGEALQRVGVSSELFDDHSPLQLGAAGKLQGLAFTLVGRLQYGYADGTWNEWHALFDNGPDGQRSAWLSEDNGAYVIAFDAPLPADHEPIVGDPRRVDLAAAVEEELLLAVPLIARHGPGEECGLPAQAGSRKSEPAPAAQEMRRPFAGLKDLMKH